MSKFEIFYKCLKIPRVTSPSQEAEERIQQLEEILVEKEKKLNRMNIYSRGDGYRYNQMKISSSTGNLSQVLYFLFFYSFLILKYIFFNIDGLRHNLVFL